MPGNVQIIFKKLGVQNYITILQAMQQFTANRSLDTQDEIWFVQHDPVFTLGKAAIEQHILYKSNIPIVNTDRGGQVTYHGPGQLMIYCLLDLKKRALDLKSLINNLQNIILNFLAQFKIPAELKPGAPGVYVLGAKICALGLKIIRGYCYHGLSLNVNMDLQPFSQINPCGIHGLAVTQLSDYGIDNMDLVIELLQPLILDLLDRKNN